MTRNLMCRPGPSPTTGVGMFLFSVSFVPNCAMPFQPQQATPPLVSAAQLWPSPTAIAIAASGGEGDQLRWSDAYHIFKLE